MARGTGLIAGELNWPQCELLVLPIGETSKGLSSKGPICAVTLMPRGVKHESKEDKDYDEY
jgi:hypothetical protein